MAEKPQVTPWGKMIRTAREAARPRLSVRAAAERAGISPENWGNVERGYQLHRGGYRAAPGSPSTVAHMAHAVGLSPERLSEAGNSEAAEILTEILRRESEAAGDRARPLFADPSLQQVWESAEGLPDDARMGVVEIVRQIRAADQRRAAAHAREGNGALSRNYV